MNGGAVGYPHAAAAQRLRIPVVSAAKYGSSSRAGPRMERTGAELPHCCSRGIAWGSRLRMLGRLPLRRAVDRPRAGLEEPLWSGFERRGRRGISRPGWDGMVAVGNRGDTGYKTKSYKKGGLEIKTLRPQQAASSRGSSVGVVEALRTEKRGFNWCEVALPHC